MQIQSTTNYDRFKYLDGNRDVHPLKVQILVGSISKHNLLHMNPIQVNEHLEVVDGQHRLEAAKELNVPIYYLIEKGLSIDDAILENSTLSSWQIKDYLKSWIDRGNENYKLLKIFSEEYEFPIGVALGLLTGSALKTSSHLKTKTGSPLRNFKNGTLKFRAPEIRTAEKIAEQIRDVKPFTVDNAWRTPAFIRAYQKAQEEISHTRIMAKLKTHGGVIRKSSSVKDYLRQLEDIVNFRAREGHTVRLYK